MAAHLNYLCKANSEHGPYCVSICYDPPQFLVLVRSKAGNLRVIIQQDTLNVPFFYRCWGKFPERYVLPAIRDVAPVDDLVLCTDESLPTALITMEEKMIVGTFKIGVGYLKRGQTSESEMLGNSGG